MRCHKCGKEVGAAAYCPYCGTKVETTPHCPQCGKEVGDTPYCPHCGKKLGKKKKEKKTWKIALAIVVALIALNAIVGDDDDDAKKKTEKSVSTSQTTQLTKSDGKTKQSSTTTKKTTEETVKATEAKSEKDTYAEAVSAYNRGSYSTAKKLFQEVSSYGDSSKYLRLIRIRNAGSNIGVGSKVYQSACGLTDSDKQDIDDAARDFYFADTAEVLVCNSDVASYYLIGEWNGGSKCYIHFIANNYGCRYNIGSKLSTNYQDTFAINDGIVTVDVVGSCAKTLKLTLVSPDCMEVYTYEKGGKCYTLNR